MCVLRIYLVVRTGVYTQGIFGVYSSRDLAVEGAKKAKSLELDDYHNFQLLTHALNEEKYSTQNYAYKPWDDEDETTGKGYECLDSHLPKLGKPEKIEPLV